MFPYIKTSAVYFNILPFNAVVLQLHSHPAGAPPNTPFLVAVALPADLAVPRGRLALGFYPDYHKSLA